MRGDGKVAFSQGLYSKKLIHTNYYKRPTLNGGENVVYSFKNILVNLIVAHALPISCNGDTAIDVFIIRVSVQFTPVFADLFSLSTLSHNALSLITHKLLL